MDELRVRQLRFVLGAVLASGLSFSANAVEYVCSVTTRVGSPTFVLVETHARDSAQRIAAAAKVRVSNGVRSPVVEVHQCIDRLHERFADSETQQRLERYPL